MIHLQKPSSFIKKNIFVSYCRLSSVFLSDRQSVCIMVCMVVFCLSMFWPACPFLIFCPISSLLWSVCPCFQVVEATCQCLLAQAEEGERLGLSELQIEQQVSRAHLLGEEGCERLLLVITNQAFLTWKEDALRINFKHKKISIL